MADTFRAVLVTNENKQFAASIVDVPVASLPAGEVLIRVACSSLNYKDGLAVTGAPGVIRQYPMVPGVDLAGTVEESISPEFRPGDQVVVTGCGTSETIWGGYGELARLNADQIVPLPSGLTLERAMGIGTAGFTAMQCILALEAHGARPEGKEIVVTGAAGGVGSTAVAFLAQLGFKVVASSGRPETHGFLKKLGAAEVIDRSVLAAPSKRPLDSERWGGAVDSVGGETLAGVIRGLTSGGSVAACGLAGGPLLSTTVFPFILRGVNLLGIDSVRATKAQRVAIWNRIAALDLGFLDEVISEHPLAEVFELGARILKGEIRGRTVIRVS